MGGLLGPLLVLFPPTGKREPLEPEWGGSTVVNRTLGVAHQELDATPRSLQPRSKGTILPVSDEPTMEGCPPPGQNPGTWFPVATVRLVGLGLLLLGGFSEAYPESALTLRTSVDLGWDPSAVWGLLAAAGLFIATGLGLLLTPIRRPVGDGKDQSSSAALLIFVFPATMLLASHAFVPFFDPERLLGAGGTLFRGLPLVLGFLLLWLRLPWRRLRELHGLQPDLTDRGFLAARCLAAIHGPVFLLVGGLSVFIPLGVMSFIYGVHGLWDPEILPIVRPHAFSMVGLGLTWLMAIRRPWASRGIFLIGGLADLGHGVAYGYSSQFALVSGPGTLHSAVALVLVLSGLGCLAVFVRLGAAGPCLPNKK